MRWVQAHGGKWIVSIGRTDLLEMYRKAGLKPLGKQTKAGAITYALCVAFLPDLKKIVQKKIQVFKALKEKTNWKLPFSFFAPAACYHGGTFKAIGEDLHILEKRKEIINADVLDAWFPPSPKVMAALQNDLPWLLQTSPPTHCAGLIKTIAEKRCVAEDCILPGAGSSDLIFRCLPYFLHTGSKVLLLDPCYGEYMHVLEHIISCTTTRFPLRRAEGFVVNTKALLAEIRKGYNMVIIVNPNSPTGLHVPKVEMEEMLAQVPTGTLVWIDETYIEYVDTTESLERRAVQSENVAAMHKAEWLLKKAVEEYMLISPKAL
ncbi:MAG: aminotransferase class I/II-fold pyridoxal phosphate-dependent enzyme [Flavisolibacter sp.]|nr:aminotransferase class I/II-fold pyridoxal phosphate-dependent enzyme [Flavisolibacter sp.]